jgi:hypothetical protein
MRENVRERRGQGETKKEEEKERGKKMVRTRERVPTRLLVAQLF